MDRWTSVRVHKLVQELESFKDAYNSQHSGQMSDDMIVNAACLIGALGVVRETRKAVQRGKELNALDTRRTSGRRP